MTDSGRGSSLRKQIIAGTLARTVINLAVRMIYPFLPEFSRGLGVPISTLVILLSVRSACGVIAPFFARLPDFLGSRRTMCAALIVFAIGTAVVVISPTFPAMMLGLGLGLLAKIIYDPALQSYFSDQVTYSQRGRVLAVIELSWSLPMIVGVPLIGWMMSRSVPPENAWRTPFAPLAVLGALSAVALWCVFPRGTVEGGNYLASKDMPWGKIMADRRVLAGLGVGLLISAASENLSVVYGTWMEESFGLAIAALGMATSVIGMAELMGEGGVMALADRWGKRRAVTFGIVISTVSYLVLPVLGTTLPGALFGLFLVFVTFEFTIVALIPLMSELVPEARARVMSSNMAAHAVGRVIGAPIGVALLNAGIVWTGLAAAFLNMLALVILLPYNQKDESAPDNKQSPSR